MTELDLIEREQDIQREALRLVRARLPESWVFDVAEQQRRRRRRVDAVVTLGSSSSGERATLVVETKRAVVPSDLPAIISHLRDSAGALDLSEAVPTVIARYLSPSVREWLDARPDVAYADATGNMQLRLTSPTVFLRDRGADRDPWRGPGRPRGTLKGEPAARVVRALADFRSPMTPKQLAQAAGSSVGATYRVLEFLEQQTLLAREARGPVVQVRWRDMLQRWSEDYSLPKACTVVPALQPRGLSALTKALAEGNVPRYAVTGSLAAANWEAYAPAKLGVIYVDNATEALDKLQLRRVDTGANIWLAVPPADFVYDRSKQIDGVTYAAPSQTAVDLLNAPGRGPAEGEALLNWMESNEKAWRA